MGQRYHKSDYRILWDKWKCRYNIQNLCDAATVLFTEKRIAVNHLH